MTSPADRAPLWLAALAVILAAFALVEARSSGRIQIGSGERGTTWAAIDGDLYWCRHGDTPKCYRAEIQP